MLRAIDHFDIKEALQDQKDLQRKKWFIAAREQRDKKAELEERNDEAFMDLASSVILATQIEIEQFQAKLDTYDEATVKALMENQEALDIVQLKIDDMLSDTHVMEDGTRVFKSEDGTWAVDEDGSRINPEVHDIDQIPQTKHTAEKYIDIKKEEQHLLKERQDILEYQENLDDARERSNSDDFSKEELDALDNELEADMPMAVKRQLPDYDPSQETSLKSDFAATVNPAMSTAIDVGIQMPMIPR